MAYPLKYYPGSRLFVRLVLWQAILGIGLCAATAMAQDTPPDDSAPAASPPSHLQDPIKAELKNKRSDVGRILRAGRFSGSEQALFDDYYTGYFLARWTSYTDPDNTARLKSFRSELGISLKQSGTGGRQSEVHDHLTALVLDYLGKRASENYHPTFRYNAILMIGDLNAREAPRPSDLPVPLPAARDLLLQNVADEKQPELLRVGALVGLVRHAKIGIPGSDARQDVADAMLTILKSERPAGTSAVGHAWMRSQAARGLAAFGKTGSNHAVALALGEVVADSKVPLRTRCISAWTLGQLEFRGASLNVSPLASGLGQLAFDACAAELKAEELSRRRLKYRLRVALIGLTGADETAAGGVSAAATEAPHKALVQRVAKSLQALLAHLDDESLDDEELTNSIKKEAVALQKLLAQGS